MYDLIRYNDIALHDKTKLFRCTKICFLQQVQLIVFGLAMEDGVDVLSHVAKGSNKENERYYNLHEMEEDAAQEPALKQGHAILK